MDIDLSREAGRAALLDTDAQELRRVSLAHLIHGLAQVGNALRGNAVIDMSADGPNARYDPRLVGIGYVGATASELLRGCLLLLDSDNRYGAAGLLRQLVEVEYLAWAFAEDQDEAAAWLASDHKDRIARWQPRHLRERSAGRFRAKDYSSHCEKGGHPTPDGCRLLLDRGHGLHVAGLVVEGLTHGRSTWRYLMSGIAAQAETLGVPTDRLVSTEACAQARNAVEAWWEFDPFVPFITGGGPSVR